MKLVFLVGKNIYECFFVPLKIAENNVNSNILEKLKCNIWYFEFDALNEYVNSFFNKNLNFYFLSSHDIIVRFFHKQYNSNILFIGQWELDSFDNEYFIKYKLNTDYNRSSVVYQIKRVKNDTIYVRNLCNGKFTDIKWYLNKNINQNIFSESQIRGKWQSVNQFDFYPIYNLEFCKDKKVIINRQNSTSNINIDTFSFALNKDYSFLLLYHKNIIKDLIQIIEIQEDTLKLIIRIKDSKLFFGDSQKMDFFRK